MQANRDYQNRRARLIAYGRWEHPLDAAGTVRRLQALAFNGWPMAALGRRLGVSRQSLRQTLRYTRVSRATAETVRALYDELWDQAPPQGDKFERRAATMTRNQARANGWVPPLAWDEDAIDDPAATPAGDWERLDKRRYGVLLEEAVELTVLGEHPEAIAVRLGVTPETVERTLQRAGQSPWRAAA